MKKAIQFGAGNIGRGFIGYLLSRSGYHVLFADVIEDIIDAINSQGRYSVEIVGGEVKKEYIEDISAISSMDKRIMDEINETNLITTAVGPNVLDKLAPTLAAGIKKRYESGNSQYLNIIPCENMAGSGDYMKEQVVGYLNEEVKIYADKYVGFVNGVVDRIVPPVERIDDDIIHVVVEEFNEWIVDKSLFKGQLPDIKGMDATDNLLAYTERKLLTLNTGHAITAYLGYLYNYITIRESILDKDIEDIVKGAMEESGNVLIKRYGFEKAHHKDYIERILNRFKNPYLKDEVTRVGRNPLQKLSYGERLIKPILGAIEYGLDKKNLIKGIAAALCYDYFGDKQAIEMQNILREDLLAGIGKITGLDIESNVIASIRDEYLRRRPD